MNLKMHIKSRKMAAQEQRELGWEQSKGTARAQCPCGAAGAGSGGTKGSRAGAPARLHREKDELIAIPAPTAASGTKGWERGAGSRRRGKRRRRRGCLGTGSLSGGECRNKKPMVSRDGRAPTLPAPIGSLPGFGCSIPACSTFTLRGGEGPACQPIEWLVHAVCLGMMKHTHGVGAAGHPSLADGHRRGARLPGSRGRHSASAQSCWVKFI